MGLNSQINEGYVRISLQVQDQKVHFEIENSKAPTKPAANPGKPSGGIGLVNVKRRLNLIYPKQYALKTEDQPDTYKVILDLDIND